MRQGQQNRRGRGRHNNGGGQGSYGGNGNSSHNNNNNSRNGQNPLARSYESNGPDVKIRGNPAHIAEKYMTLARDAHSVGDSVLAESYLQHAEHYNRIIMAYREQQTGGEGQVRQRPQHDSQDGGSEPMGDDDGEGNGGGDVQIRGQEPQPGMFDNPNQRFAERPSDQPVREDRGNRDDHRQARGYEDRQPRRQDGNRDHNREGGRRDRYEGGNRGYNGNREDRPQDRSDRGNDRPERIDRPDRPERRDRFDRPRTAGQGGYQAPERQAGDGQSPDRQSQDRQSPERQYAERTAAERGAVEFAPVDVRPAIDVSPPAASAMDVDPVAKAVVHDEPREAPVPRRRGPAADRFAEGSQEQPEFLRRPVRRPRRETAAPPVDAPDVAAAGEAPVGKPGDPL